MMTRSTLTGQVLQLPGERSVFDLNAQHEAELAPQRERLWETTSADAMAMKIREKAGVRPDDQFGGADVEQNGTR